MNKINNLSICPSCNQNSLKVENGCHECIECGAGKCD